MSDFINHIYIGNFKSIKSCEVTGCKRINLFIGRPNVGKSNILEALSLFSIPFLRDTPSKKLSNLLRLENLSELFYKGNSGNEINVSTNVQSCTLLFHPKTNLSIKMKIGEGAFKPDSVIYSVQVDEKFITRINHIDKNFKSLVRKYSYQQDVVYKAGHSKYLIPPFGSNLLSIIENYPELKAEVINLFNEYNLEIAFDRASQTIKVIQKNNDGIFLIPYNSIADTLQRVIFYKAAIASNDNSILLFEEPEAHAFPPYMTQLTQDMIHKRDNQYFIATHSPFILNDLLENAPDELAVFIVYWENGSTQVRALSPNEMHEAYQSGVDFFTNSESFIG